MQNVTTRPMETLKERYDDVRRRVAEAAARAGRRPEDVLIVAVTKYASPEAIRELIEIGHADFGENRIQQLIRRVAVVDEFLARHKTMTASRAVNLPRRVRWHMIGHLQRNKARKACEVSRLIHSVDSLRLAEELQTIALRRDKPLDILVEVNCSGEASKHGCPVPAAGPLAEQIDTMINVRVRGLMTMAAPGVPESEVRATFARCHELFDEIRRSGIGEGAFNLLSMGMSGDFEIAIEEGANIVRVGTSIFGNAAPAGDPEESGDPASDIDDD